MTTTSTSKSPAAFNVGLLEEHETRLVTLIEALRAAEPLDQPSYDRLTRRHGRGDGAYRKSEIIYAVRHLAGRLGWTEGEDAFIARIRMKPVRTGSGVAPVTVLTRPHPCPGRCVFCPSDVKMPKSYLSMEPGAPRAARNHFDPYRQTWNRLRALFHNGHRLDKVELIILGGTWTAYPEAYRIWFVKRCLDALNEFQGQGDPPDRDPPHLEPVAPLPLADQERLRQRPGTTYNQVLAEHLTAHPSRDESADWTALARTQLLNETAAVRCVGLSVETRPDALDHERVPEALRRLGVTKVQIGYQSLDDQVLLDCDRGHDVDASRRATLLLREAGFKVQAHWMPNLPGSTPEADIRDFKRLFADPDFRPDELKIYPLCLIESSPLMQRTADRAWKAYSEQELLAVLVEAVATTPPYCRLTRVIRDIPSHDILAGNRVNNLRETVEALLGEQGRQIRDIRARQIRRPLRDFAEVALETLEYEVGSGQEIFLQGVTRRDELVGFLRLSLPKRPSRIAELGSSAVIREVHVYGNLSGLAAEEQGASQHRGLGGRLIAQAREVARDRGFSNLAVISAIGTREYYRRRGFAGDGLYQHARLQPTDTSGPTCPTCPT